jgi:cell wall-associated NlpC family hydrolase
LRSTTRTYRKCLLTAGAVSISLALAAPAVAQTGGSPAPGGTAPPPQTVPGARAKLTKKGKAIPPAGAPQAVINAIQAGNRIRKKPYIYGGGHRSFKAKGYDCSGAVSYVLNAAGLLSSPMPSGPLMRWEDPGKGSWITVYANRGHAYAVIAGLRWDTSAMGSGGKGPRWRATKRSPKGFAVRHAAGL